MVLLIISACVLHNFCLIHDDFDEGYFGDDSDDESDDEGDGAPNTVNFGPTDPTGQSGPPLEVVPNIPV